MDVTRSEEVRDWVEGIGTKRGIDVVVSNVSSLSVTDESASWKSAYNTEFALPLFPHSHSQFSELEKKRKGKLMQ